MPDRKQALYWSSIWLVYTVAGLLVPAGIGGLYVAAQDTVMLGDFTDGGQFGLYSSGLLIGTLYLIAQPKSFRLPRTELLLCITAVGLLLSSVFFAVGALSLKGEDVNIDVVRIPSIGLFVVSVLVGFYAVFQDYIRSEPDAWAARKAEEHDLREQFEKTEQK